MWDVDGFEQVEGYLDLEKRSSGHSVILCNDSAYQEPARLMCPSGSYRGVRCFETRALNS